MPQLSPIMPAILKNTIRRLRFERSMTQEELALRAGVSRQTIMSIERGATNPSVTLAFIIAKALQTPVEEVFAVEGGLVPV
jgi:putative transcriptional regulator